MVSRGRGPWWGGPPSSLAGHAPALGLTEEPVPPAQRAPASDPRLADGKQVRRHRRRDRIRAPGLGLRWALSSTRSCLWLSVPVPPLALQPCNMGPVNTVYRAQTPTKEGQRPPGRSTTQPSVLTGPTGVQGLIEGGGLCHSCPALPVSCPSSAGALDPGCGCAVKLHLQYGRGVWLAPVLGWGWGSACQVTTATSQAKESFHVVFEKIVRCPGPTQSLTPRVRTTAAPAAPSPHLRASRVLPGVLAPAPHLGSTRAELLRPPRGPSLPAAPGA